MFTIHIIAHFSFQFFKISRSSEDKRHKGGEGGQDAKAESEAEMDEKWYVTSGVGILN